MNTLELIRQKKNKEDKLKAARAAFIRTSSPRAIF